MTRAIGLGTSGCVAAIALMLAVTSLAQPPERPGPPGGPPPGGPGGFPPGGPRDGDFRPPPDPLREALDANHDQELDADEIKNAPQAILKLDTDGDGRLSHDEMRPPPPPGAPRDFRGGPREGRGGPPEGGPREGRGGPPGDGPREGRGGPPEGGPREGRGPGFGGLGGPGGGSGGPGGGPGGFGPPSPDRFVDRALTFDMNGDGKLDRDELFKFAEDMMRMRTNAGGGPGRGPGGGGPPEGGFRGGRGGPPGGGPPGGDRPSGGDGGDRPQRPRRPD